MQSKAFERFPVDFMFRLSAEEKAEVVANCDHLAKLKYSATLPYAFTEHGALMLGNVLKSDRAVEVSPHGCARLRAIAADAGLQRRTVAQAGYAGKELRHQIQSNI